MGGGWLGGSVLCCEGVGGVEGEFVGVIVGRVGC